MGSSFQASGSRLIPAKSLAVLHEEHDGSEKKMLNVIEVSNGEQKKGFRKLWQAITETLEQPLRCALALALRLLGYGYNCCNALMHTIWLPPLPIYWDRLAKCDWHIWQEEEFLLASVFRQEVRRQCQLRIVASFSAEHESLYWGFMKYGEGARKPARPSWFRL